MPPMPPADAEAPLPDPTAPETSSTLTLDVSGDDTFADAQAGDRNVCITVYGTVESNDGTTLVLNVDRAELMPEDHGDEEDDYDEDEEEPAPVMASKTTVKRPSAAPKSVLSIMVGTRKP